MNYEITHILNELGGVSIFTDALIFVFAEFIPWFVGFLFLLLIFFSRKQPLPIFISAVLTLIVTKLLSVGLKLFFGIDRPFQVYETIEPVFITYGFGAFPSTHAMFFAALATLSFFYIRKISSFFIVMAFVIGIMRVIAGVHFFFDVLAGWICGFIVAYTLVYISRKIIGTDSESSIFSK